MYCHLSQCHEDGVVRDKVTTTTITILLLEELKG